MPTSALLRAKIPRGISISHRASALYRANDPDGRLEDGSGSVYSPLTVRAFLSTTESQRRWELLKGKTRYPTRCGNQLPSNYGRRGAVLLRKSPCWAQVNFAPPQSSDIAAACGPATRWLCNTNLLRLSHVLLAPKAAPKGAKGGAKKAAATSVTAIPKARIDCMRFNIFVDRPSVDLNVFEVPNWLRKEHAKRYLPYGKLGLKFIHGKEIRTATHKQYIRFQRLHRRYHIQLNNFQLTKKLRRAHRQFLDV